VAPRSTTITGSLADWRSWTGLPFDATGPVSVPEALVPVFCDLDRDVATYVEPNVWVHHRLSPPGLSPPGLSPPGLSPPGLSPPG
jgi:hypothetical protein